MERFFKSNSDNMGKHTFEEEVDILEHKVNAKANAKEVLEDSECFLLFSLGKEEEGGEPGVAVIGSVEADIGGMIKMTEALDAIAMKLKTQIVEATLGGLGEVFKNEKD